MVAGALQVMHLPALDIDEYLVRRIYISNYKFLKSTQAMGYLIRVSHRW